MTSGSGIDANLPPRLRFLAGGGDATRRILARDWIGHPLGPPEDWPEALKTSLSTVLNSPESMILAWGRDALTFFFNETYFPLLGPRLDWAMGAPFTQVWADAWDQAKPIIDEAFAGRSQRFVDLPWKLATDRGAEDTWWTFSYSRILGADGEVAGLLIVTNETTRRVLTDRRSAAAEAQLLRAQEGGGIGLFSIDADGILTPTANFCRLYGVEPVAEAPSVIFERLLVPEDRHLASSSDTRASGRAPLDVEYRICRADTGEQRWIARKGELELDGEGRFVRFAGVARDITEQVEARRALARRQASQATLLVLGDRLRDARDADGVARAANETLGRALGASLVGYGLVDPSREMLRIDHDWTDGAQSFAGEIPFSNFTGLVADLQGGAPVAVDDVLADPRTHATGQALVARGVAAFVAVPLFEHGSFRALLYIGMPRPFAWDEETLSLVREVADRLRIASERARSEEELRRSEEQFRVFAQAVPNQVWAANPEGTLYWVNEQVDAYVGPAAGGLADSVGWTAAVHPDDRAAAAGAWQAALSSGTPYDVEFRIRAHNGAYRWFLVRARPVRGSDGAIVRWVGTNTDIDDARRQADALASINATLEDLVAQRTADRNLLWQLSSDLMLVAGLDGRIEAVNPAWTHILGWSEADLLGRPIFDFIHPDDVRHSLEGAAAISRGERFARFENRYRHRDDGYRHIGWAAGPGAGKIIAVGRDETADKARAARLAAAEDQLRQAQKMEAVGQLTGGIAHDFNNMLTGVIGSMDLLKRHLGDGQDARTTRYIDAATTSAQRAARLTQRLLAFSRRQSLDIRAVDVDALVAGLEDLLRRTLGENVGLEIARAADTWTVSTDANQLESALLNLAINARDAMPGGGRLTIATANIQLDEAGAAAVNDIPAGAYVTISVSDTGTGMSPEVIAKAFDPFFTTKPIGEGTGLGLSMIWGFAKQSGGHAEIHSAAGGGTTVRLYLPRADGEADLADASETVTQAARAGESILLVEDDPAVRMLVGDLLRDLGYRVEQAADARQALARLPNMARVDLLITDVGLPGMSGRELADRAREQRPALPVLFVTGYAEGAAVRGGFLAPGMDMIGKPFAIDALSEKIRAMLG